MMKTIVLHGTDRDKLYKRLIVFMNEAKKRGWEISENSEVTPSLFGAEKFVVSRDYHKKINKFEGTLVIYNEGTIPASAVKELNADKVEKFDLPIQIWSFLNKITVKGLHEIIKTEAIEYIFSMIAWKLKQNYTKNQSERNAKLINELAEIDIKAKTGKGNLITLLDLFITKNLT